MDSTNSSRGLRRVGQDRVVKVESHEKGIFGRQYTGIDNIQRLPEKLPELFLALTK